ncbi:hypothetical protein SAMN05216559_1332 [Halomicrobium zhouii]|uniref:Uncharacterized protein n=1 Tax=Halomicrobium zhouii TaxID=767519 RepID=A0A1I6KQW2_9EURY|nr:hypothetical protein [Halomicrobium zhouii]SFR93606.1 hypothetical protein SAMN05216559_1332 [Halomicrobium zhouii]
MTTDATWQSVRDRCEVLDHDEVLVTPNDERVFVVERIEDDRVTVEFLDGGSRDLRRDQFDVLADSVDDEGLDLDSLPPGVGPYVTVLSLAPQYAVEGAGAGAGTLRRADATDSDPDDVPIESPFVRSRWDVRRPPEEVHDDALLVADFLERHDVTALEELPAEELVDVYVLLSDVQWGADDLRRDVGRDLLDHVGPDGRLHGQYGTVSRTRRERRTLKDEDVVLEVLDEAGVPREWVLGVDEDKLDVVLATSEIGEAEVYDVHEQYYVQKTGVESDAKRSRLQGLKDRLAALEDEEAAELHEEIDALEDRIDDVLATG